MNYKRDVITQCVRKGAELLDEALPGWHKVINERLLNLATPNPKGWYSDNAKEGTGCILCQLDVYLEEERLPNKPIRLADFGNYNDGLQSLRNYTGEYIDGGYYGFDILDEFEDDDGEIWVSPYDASDYYAILDELWKKEIAERNANSN